MARRPSIQIDSERLQSEQVSQPIILAPCRTLPVRFPLSPGRTGELIVLLAIVVAGLLLRALHLETMPPGLHGDEAIAGLEANRILAEGGIGPYSPPALGQPSGPLYLTAVSVWLLGDTVTAVRIVPALLSTLTIVALYVIVRRHLGIACALVAAAVLATMSWHIQLGRIGFPISAWPLVAVIAVGVQLEAVRARTVAWWLLSGMAVGLGVHAYHSHLVLSAILLAHAAVAMLRATPLWRMVARWLGAWLLGFVLVTWPMIAYALRPDSGYFNHARQVSIFRTDDWTSRRSWIDRIGLLADRYRDYWDGMVRHARIDGVDGSGVATLLPVALLVPIAIGFAVLIRSRGRMRGGSLLVLALVICLLLPGAAAITIDGEARRTFAMAPMVAVLVAFGTVCPLRALLDAWRARAPGRAWRLRIAAVALMSALIVPIAGWVTWHNLHAQFVLLPDSDSTRFIFAVEMTAASRYMATLPPETRVYFYSERWSFDYETRQFLAPETDGENRSSAFGDFSMTLGPGDHDVTFILLGHYRDELETLWIRYPTGVTFIPGDPDTELADAPFVAYRVIVPGAPPSPVTP